MDEPYWECPRCKLRNAPAYHACVTCGYLKPEYPYNPTKAELRAICTELAEQLLAEKRAVDFWRTACDANYKQLIELKYPLP